jgi:low temperature requirement protein LtrA
MTNGTLLRSRTGDHHGRVGFVELFLDLVFVFAVTQISHLLLTHPDIEHALQSAFLLTAMWVVWMWTTWATNWLDVERTPTRIALFLVMAGGLVLAAAMPHAFGERGLSFAATYVAIQIGRTAFLVHALRAGKANERRNFERVLVYLFISGAFWIGGGLAEDTTLRWALWLAALFLDMASPLWGFWTPFMGRSTTEDWRVDPEHMSERSGLFMIIALGESVILIGATFAGADIWDAAHFGALASAFGGAVAMWWIYFATIAEDAREEFVSAENPGALARTAYTYAHIPMVAGIVLGAVGNEMVLAHPTGHIELTTTLIVIGGPALFLAGSTWFFWIFCGKPPISHILGLGALLVCGLAASSIPPVWLSATTTLALVGVGAWETYGYERPHGADRNTTDT